MQAVNGAQFLNITFVFQLFGAAPIPLFGIVIVPLTCAYASSVNLIWILVFHVPCEWLFVLTQFFVPNLDGWFGVLLPCKFIILWYSIIILC